MFCLISIRLRISREKYSSQISINLAFSLFFEMPLRTCIIRPVRQEISILINKTLVKLSDSNKLISLSFNGENLRLAYFTRIFRAEQFRDVEEEAVEINSKVIQLFTVKPSIGFEGFGRIDFGIAARLSHSNFTLSMRLEAS